MRRRWHLAWPGRRHRGRGGRRPTAVVRPWRRTWGVDPDEAARLLPGDELVADADAASRRAAITIDAPPEAASGRGSSRWATGGRLVQLRPARHARRERRRGSSRTGSRSRSATSMPTHPGRRLRGRSRSSRTAPSSCTSTTRSSSARAAADGDGRRRPRRRPAGLAASGAILRHDSRSEFAATLGVRPRADRRRVGRG